MYIIHVFVVVMRQGFVMSMAYRTEQRLLRFKHNQYNSTSINFGSSSKSLNSGISCAGILAISGAKRRVEHRSPDHGELQEHAPRTQLPRGGFLFSPHDFSGQ